MIDRGRTWAFIAWGLLVFSPITLLNDVPRFVEVRWVRYINNLINKYKKWKRRKFSPRWKATIQWIVTLVLGNPILLNQSRTKIPTNTQELFFPQIPIVWSRKSRLILFPRLVIWFLRLGPLTISISMIMQVFLFICFSFLSWWSAFNVHTVTDHQVTSTVSSATAKEVEPFSSRYWMLIIIHLIYLWRSPYRKSSSQRQSPSFEDDFDTPHFERAESSKQGASRTRPVSVYSTPTPSTVASSPIHSVASAPTTTITTADTYGIYSLLSHHI